jgi:hypothetical protein
MRRNAMVRPFIPAETQTDLAPNTRSKTWFTMGDAATRWEISPETVRKRIAKGDVKVQRFGRLVRISIDEILRVEREGWK